MSDRPWSIEAQAERRAELAAHCRDILRPHMRPYDPNGGGTDQAWAALAFLQGEGDDVRLGNDLLRSVVLYGGAKGRMEPGMWRIHEGLIIPCINACHRYPDRVDAETRAMVAEWVVHNLPPLLAHDKHLMGLNDNFPVMTTNFLILGGQLVGSQETIEEGRANLLELRAMLTRRGTLSEYGPGYWTHRLEPMAEIATHAAEEETRALALAVEERMWAEVCCNWHPLTRHHAAASGRHAGIISFQCILNMYHVFGPAVEMPGMSRWTSLAGPDFERMERAYKNETRAFCTYMVPYANAFANADFHVPDYLAELVYRKPERYDYFATAEVGPCTDRFYPSVDYATDGFVEWHVQDFGQFYPGTEVILRTHLRPHFVLSTASAQFFDGSLSRPWHLHYARRDEVQDPVDIGNWECRYVLNNKPVGAETKYWETPEVFHPGGGPIYPAGWDEGRYFMLQHDATSLVLSRPKFREHWAITGLRQDIALSTHFGPPGRVCLGDQELAGLHADSEQPQWVFVDEGTVYMGFLPLIGRYAERETAMRLHQNEKFLVISLYNYQGPPVAMKDYEMAWMGNGFVCEVAEATDYADFAEFRETMMAAEVLDDTYLGARTVRYAREDLELAMMIDPQTEHFIFATINGLQRPAPQLAATGLEVERLPFLGPGRELVGKTNLAWAKRLNARPDGHTILDWKRVWRG